jgi:hypothetical protein
MVASFYIPDHSEHRIHLPFIIHSIISVTDVDGNKRLPHIELCCSDTLEESGEGMLEWMYAFAFS